MITSILICIAAAAHLASGAAIDPRAGCEIDPLVYANSPLIIPTGSETFIYPEYGETTLTFEVGEIVDLVCPGSQLIVLGSVAQEVVQATCISNRRFRILGERTLWTQVSCRSQAVASSRKTGRRCEEDGSDAQIGFSLTDGRFLRVIDVCFDETSQSPLYTYYNLTKSIGNNAKGTPRPQFEQDAGFYSLGSTTVNSLYARAVQRATVNGLIGLSATSTKYIDNGNWFFLARGHLTARADFFYPAQQNATFKYVNACPQWQSFNGINWNEVELSTRAYADRIGADLQVWTGVYGVTSLPHETTGEEVDLYFYVNSATRAMPIPELYWKVVYDPSTRRGVALIGLNNPHQSNVQRSVICPDVSDSLNWVTWAKNNITQGYSYACSVPDLRKAVSYAPDLDVSGLLL